MRSPLYVLIIIASHLQLFSFANIDENIRFKKWLHTITDGVSFEGDSHFNQINRDIEKYSQIAEFSERIPLELKTIPVINLGNCNEMLESRLHISPRLGTMSHGARYAQFYAKLQFNLCLQDMELRKAKHAAESMDKVKWAVWHDAISSLKTRVVGDVDVSRHMKDSALKLAWHVKRHVPLVEREFFDSRQDHIGMLATHVGAITNGVCPYVTGDILISHDDYSQVLRDYLDKNRAIFQGDEVPQIWARSMEICSDKKELASLTSLVIQIFEDRLNSIQIGHPIGFLQWIIKNTDERSEQSIENNVLSLRNISSDLELKSCDNSEIERRNNLELNYRTGTDRNLEAYIKSMNDLQYYVCDIALRFKAANLASTLPSSQVAQLEEFRSLYRSNNSRDETHRFLNPEPGYHVCMSDFIKRYNEIPDDRRGQTTPRKRVDRPWEMEIGSRPSGRVDGGQAIDRVDKMQDEIKKKMCSNVLEVFPEDHIKSLKTLFSVRPNWQMGETPAHLVDYAIICDQGCSDQRDNNDPFEASTSP